MNYDIANTGVDDKRKQLNVVMMMMVKLNKYCDSKQRVRYRITVDVVRCTVSEMMDRIKAGGKLATPSPAKVRLLYS